MTISANINRYMGLARETLLATGAKIRKDFADRFTETMILCMVLKKFNFIQMGKYSNYTEQTFRNTFSKRVDWCTYNMRMIKRVFPRTDLLATAIDQSYIPKSGKKTYGAGSYWSGCAGAVKHGCEITGLAVVDATKKEGLAFRAVQTPGREWRVRMLLRVRRSSACRITISV